MGGFLRQILAPGTKAPWWLTACIVLLLGAAGWWYVHEAVEHGYRSNGRIDYELGLERKVLFKDDKKTMEAAGRPTHAYDLNDQRVYMNYAMGMRENLFGTFVTRMRMPMFMWTLSLAADGTPRTQMNYEQLEVEYLKFFPKARAFNVGLSVVMLVVMFFALRPWLGNWLGVAFILVAAFQLYILKSPYVQPEIMQTTIITVTVVWVFQTLCDTTWKNALITGLLLCFWHMTKANALVALGLMGAVMGLKLVFTSKERRQIIVAGLVTVTAYVLPMSPWLYKSWVTFGSPFYNVQSKYYMWAEDSKEKSQLQKLGIDRNLNAVDKDGDLKVDHPELLPSPGKYWREHSWDEIKDRLTRGIDLMTDAVFKEYTQLAWLQMLWGGILVWACARRWEETVTAVGQWKWGIIFVVGLLAAFVCLFGWFTPLKVGPRLLNSISLIPIFFCMAGARWLLRTDTVVMRGVTLSTEKLLVLCFIATWFALTAWVLPSELENGYFAG